MQIHRSYLSYAFLTAFLGAVFSLFWWQSASYPLWVWGGIVGVLITGGAGLLPGKTRMAAAFLIAGMLGILVAFLVVARSTRAVSPLSGKSGSGQTALGAETLMTQSPTGQKTGKKRYTIDIDKLVDSAGDTINIDGLVLSDDYDVGMKEQAAAKPASKAKTETPEEQRELAFEKYLSREGIYGMLPGALLRGRTGGYVRQGFSFLFNFRESFQSQIKLLFPEPHASLLGGLLTGAKGSIPKRLVKDLTATGLNHIIAISGYNITMIMTFLSVLFFWMPVRWRFIPTSLVIILFTIFVGASAPVVRAAIIGILGLLALQIDRLRVPRLTVLWTLFLMLAWNPTYLWYDIGFQLSFLAILGLMEISPIISYLLRHMPPLFGMKDSLIMTIAVQIFAVPWIAFLFGRISLIAPIANVLAVPVVPFAMLFGFLGTVTSWTLFPLGQWIGYMGWAFLQWIIIVARVFALVPYASIKVTSLGPLIITLYYALIVLLIAWIRYHYDLDYIDIYDNAEEREEDERG